MSVNDTFDLNDQQQDAVRFILERSGRAGAFSSTGFGKTRVGIKVGVSFKPVCVLIICRADDVHTWKKEIAALLDMQAHDIRAGCKPKLGFWITTHDKMRSPTVQQIVKRTAWCVCLLDESHAIKSPKAERSQAIVKYTRHVPCRVAFTATPMEKHPIDLFYQCFFIDSGKTLGASWWWFLNTYFIQDGYDWIPKRNKAAELHAKLSSLIYVDDKKITTAGLPPIEHRVMWVDMTPDQADIYNFVRTQWELNGIEYIHVVAVHAKLSQIASGFVSGEDGTSWIMDDESNPRLCGLNAVLKRLAGKKVVVWAAFVPEMQAVARVCEARGLKYVLFRGTRKARVAARESFASDPTVSVFIAQADSGVGMNELTVACDAVYLSNSYRSISRRQTKGRLQRKGAEHHRVITVWDIVVRNTVDEVKYMVLRKRLGFVDAFIAHLRKD